MAVGEISGGVGVKLNVGDVGDCVSIAVVGMMVLVGEKLGVAVGAGGDGVGVAVGGAIVGVAERTGVSVRTSGVALGLTVGEGVSVRVGCGLITTVVGPLVTLVEPGTLVIVG